MSKYNARKTEIDGIVFDSKKEADYYCELRIRKMARDIKGYQRQVEYILLPSFKHNKKTYRPIKYLADFVIEHNDGSFEVVDVKGYRTKEYMLKKKLLLHRFPNIIFSEV